MTQNIILHDVGLRDGLQMEHQTVPTDRKLGWVEALMDAGMDIIQVGSFVHPTKVPQMADTDRLFQELASPERPRRPGVILSALVLNEKGLERGLACGVEMFCMGVSASETHSRKNTGMSVAEATGRIIAMARSARAADRRVQLSVQSAFGCGYEGAVDEERVLGIVREFLEAGFSHLSLADTAGHATIDTTGAGSATLVAKWTYTRDGKTVPVKEDSPTITPTGPATTEFHISKPDGWPVGAYAGRNRPGRQDRRDEVVQGAVTRRGGCRLTLPCCLDRNGSASPRRAISHSCAPSSIVDRHRTRPRHVGKAETHRVARLKSPLN